MRLIILLSFATVLAGCATTSDKVSFAEALGPASLPSPVAPVVTRRPRLPAQAQASQALHATLLRFGERSRALRRNVPRGSPLPGQQADNWEHALAALDEFLLRRAVDTAPPDVVRARLVLEAELEEDAKTYGSFPAGLAEAALERITRLGVRMSAVRRLGVKVKPSGPLAFRWPIEPVALTSLFGRRLHPISRSYQMHSGVDLAARPGQLVAASAGGLVVFSGWNGAHGKQVEVRHPGGYSTRYSHLSQLLVEVGTPVDQGDPLGLAGSTGRSTGVHLHLELWHEGQPQDPLDEFADPSPSVASL